MADDLLMSSTLSLASSFVPSSATAVGIDSLVHALSDISQCLLTLKEVIRPQEQVFRLDKLVKSLCDVCLNLDDNAYKKAPVPRLSSSNLARADKYHLPNLWGHVEVVSRRCCDETAVPLEERLRQIVDSSPYLNTPSLVNSKLRIPQGDLVWYDDIAQELYCQAETLRALHAAINLINEKTETTSDIDLSATIRESAQTLKSLVITLKETLDSITEYTASKDILYLLEALKEVNALRAAWSSVSINQHFWVRKSSNHIYTGRRQQLQIIEHAFHESTSPLGLQKRFVIQGGPGAGKTELALKYAEETMSQYWGIFWIDASSRANAAQSYIDMAKLGGEEPNENAVKHWLSSRGSMYPWLLIIDNADDDQLHLDDLFPPGHNGCILVTTRDPARVTYGTAGSKHLELGRMDSNEAKQLLLRAANQPKPWRQRVTELAASICEHLHFLPLALVHAGKAWFNNDCEDMNKYTGYLDDQIERIRRDWGRNRSRSRSRPSRDKKRYVDDEDSLSIFASYEILFESLERSAATNQTVANALQLLQVLSYLHFHNIRLDILIQAAIGPLKEVQEVLAQQQDEEDVIRHLGLEVPHTWKVKIQDIVRVLLGYFDLPPVLPEVLKNPEGLDITELEKEVRDNIREALKVLIKRSLVMKSKEHDGDGWAFRYHIHPFVHKWVRERPWLPIAQQALFCQIATTVLSRAVKLVGGDAAEETAMRREMKPHVDFVRQCSSVIQGRIQENQRRNKSIWSILSLNRGSSVPTFGKLQAEECGRFGRIYMDSGAFEEAEQLFRRVHHFVVSRLGHDHHVSHLVKLGLSGALFHQTRYNESAALQREVYESRKSTLGEKHPRTLQIMTILASTALSQGRMTESLNLCKDARVSLSEIYGPDHKETIKCINQIGKVQYHYFNWDECLKYQKEALERCSKLTGEHAVAEVDVLGFQEDFATALLRIGERNLAEGKQDLAEQQMDQAETMLAHVVKRRTEILGKDHPYTLLSKANLGRAMATRGRLDDADELMSATLAIAVRNIGPDHLAVIAGKMWYSQVLILKGEYDEAHKYLREATDKTKYAKASAEDGEHPDRIFAVWTLIKCLQEMGDFEEALKECRDLQRSIPLTGGHGLGKNHKFNVILAEKVEFLQHIRSRLQNARE